VLHLRYIFDLCSLFSTSPSSTYQSQILKHLSDEYLLGISPDDADGSDPKSAMADTFGDDMLDDDIFQMIEAHDRYLEIDKYIAWSADEAERKPDDYVMDDELTDQDAPYDIDEDYEDYEDSPIVNQPTINPPTAGKRPPSDVNKRTFDTAFVDNIHRKSPTPPPREEPIRTPRSISSSLTPPPATISPPPTHAPGRGKSTAIVNDMKRQYDRKVAALKRKGLSIEHYIVSDDDDDADDDDDEPQPPPKKRARPAKTKTPMLKDLVIPPRKVTKKAKDVVAVDDDDDEDMSDVEEAESDDGDDFYAPTKKEKTRLARTISKSKAAAVKPTIKVSRVAPPIPSTGALTAKRTISKPAEQASITAPVQKKLSLEEICEKEAVEARSLKEIRKGKRPEISDEEKRARRDKRRAFLDVRKGKPKVILSHAEVQDLLEDSTDFDSDSDSILSPEARQPFRSAPPVNYGYFQRGPARSIFDREKDPMLFSQEDALKSLDLAYDFFPKLGGKLRDTRLIALRKLARIISPEHTKYIPRGKLAWTGFCARHGLFDVTPETTETHEKERERRIRVVRSLITKGMIEDFQIPSFFDVFPLNHPLIRSKQVPRKRRRRELLEQRTLFHASPPFQDNGE
jgi:hypothetical protein